ncbi:MAG: bestrophin-like domain [Candidatus Kariarchaeaceae archaeon]|jgi:hypothetical protein
MMEIDTSGLKVAVKTIFVIFLGMTFGFLMNQDPLHPYLIELSDIRNSDVVSFLGTIYALITAFTLVNVWSHYDETKRSYAEENEALIALWVNTDYLEDPSISKQMKTALLKYLDVTINEEFPLLSKRNDVNLPSTEFINIKKVIDHIRFDDPRDPMGFEALIISFRNLTSARNQRIEFALLKVPKLLKYFYFLASLIFWVGFMIQGFDSDMLYYTVLFMGTLIVVMSYTIIFDLDTPLGGLVNLSLKKYEISRDFIEKTDHEVYSKRSDHPIENS